MRGAGGGDTILFTAVSKQTHGFDEIDTNQ